MCHTRLKFLTFPSENTRTVVVWYSFSLPAPFPFSLWSNHPFVNPLNGDVYLLSLPLVHSAGLTYCPSSSHCSFIPLLSLHPLSPPSFTYGGRFCSPSISITVRREALCIHSPPPPSPPVPPPSSPPLCLFSCVFSCPLQLEAYSLVVHEERIFFEWPQRMAGTGGGHCVIDCRDLRPALGTRRVAPRPCGYSGASATATHL